MALNVPFKLLEINVISAQDLPPVSKMLRTFAVAYINPDHKLTTRVDHQGHTNPTWNYKIVFHVEDRFLKQESAAVTIEIYNVAWLRDLPIGTTRLLLNNISPPLHNSTFRRVALQICRPSGHLQGTLNLGVQLIDNNVPDGEMVIPSIINRNNDERTVEEDDKSQDQTQENDYYFKEEVFDDQIMITSRPEYLNSLSPSSRITDKLDKLELALQPETKSVVDSNGSLFSDPVRPLPSEVAKELKKESYSAEWNERGSSVFDSWTETDDKSIEDRGLIKSRSAKWRTGEQIPLTIDQEKPSTPAHRRKRSDSKKGLFSCFGNAYGLEFSFICGSKAMKKKKKEMNRNTKQDFQLVNVPQENLRRFHVGV